MASTVENEEVADLKSPLELINERNTAFLKSLKDPTNKFQGFISPISLYAAELNVSRTTDFGSQSKLVSPHVTARAGYEHLEAYQQTSEEVVRQFKHIYKTSTRVLAKMEPPNAHKQVIHPLEFKTVEMKNKY